jgi:hypothetical protein
MIQFSNPAALWLLTLILPIVLLYLLKRKRTDVTVPSLLVWKQAIEDSQAQTPFQKLRSNILLFLQILIVVLITALLAEPHSYHLSKQTMRWILVIDTSAGMQATDVKPNRFTAAKDRMQALLDSIPASDQVMLVSFSLEASVLQPFSENHEPVRAKLSSLEPEDVGSDWSRLLLILKPLLKQQPRPKIVIASDFSGSPPNLAGGIPFESIAVGTSGNNLAITRAALRTSAENLREQTLFYRIINLSTQPRQAEVELYMDGNLIDAAAVSLKTGESLDQSKQLAVAQPVKIEIRITNTDDLALDNDFILYAEPVEPLPVQVDYKDPFLLRALKVLPAVRVSEKAEVRITRGETAEEIAGIIFRTAPASSPVSEVVQWNRSHPAFRFVDAGLWRFAHCLRLETPSDGEVLLETRQGPAACAVDRYGKRCIVLGFDLDQSDMAGYAGFPIFLQNSLEWIAEGLRRPLPTLTGGQDRYEGPQEQEVRKTYLNFADAAESNIVPAKPHAKPVVEKETVATARSLASYLLLLLIATVMLEWWAFHRRIDSN